MRVAITGATGNVGTALVRALLADDEVEEIIGIARRTPAWNPPRVRWVQGDVARDPLTAVFTGVDAVVHLAWLIQPSRDVHVTDRVNVDGSRRVFTAALRAGVPLIVHASSVAAYRPADPSTPVDESWPTDGIPTSYYSRQKVAVERMLDGLEGQHPETRFARLRPGLIFQRENAAQVRRFFGGPFVPGWAIRPSLVPIVPRMPGLAGQVIHAMDVAELYRAVVRSPTARGAYNAATQPPLDADALARLMHARPVSVPRRAVRAFVGATWKAHLQPVSPDWLDVVLGVPVMRTDRARTELGWEAQRTSEEVMQELLDGLHHADGFPTPPLDPHAGGLLRLREVRTGVGGPTPEDRRSASGASRT